MPSSLSLSPFFCPHLVHWRYPSGTGLSPGFLLYQTFLTVRAHFYPSGSWGKKSARVLSYWYQVQAAQDGAADVIIGKFFEVGYFTANGASPAYKRWLQLSIHHLRSARFYRTVSNKEKSNYLGSDGLSLESDWDEGHSRVVSSLLCHASVLSHTHIAHLLPQSPPH